MANSIETYAKQAGIDPSKILIVNAKNDYVDWSWGYGNGAPHNPHPWSHVFLTDDITNPQKPLLRHGGPIDGWLANHSYDMVIDGKTLRENKSLVEIYRRYIKGEPL